MSRNSHLIPQSSKKMKWLEVDANFVCLWRKSYRKKFICISTKLKKYEMIWGTCQFHILKSYVIVRSSKKYMKQLGVYANFAHIWRKACRNFFSRSFAFPNLIYTLKWAIHRPQRCGLGTQTWIVEYKVLMYIVKSNVQTCIVK